MPELRVVANYTIQESRTEEVLALLQEFRRAVRSEEGNLAFDVFQNAEQPNRVALIERYVSREAFQVHRDTPHFAEIALGKVIPLLADRVVELYDMAE